MFRSICHVGSHSADRIRDLPQWRKTSPIRIKSPVFGARPLKRLIQKDIENPLALQLLKGEFKDGDRILIESSGEGLTFKKEEAFAVV